MVEVKESVMGGKMIESQTIVLNYNSTRLHGLVHSFPLIFIFVQSHESSRGDLSVLCPIRVHIAPHGEWRFGIEAKRLIALVTSIRIHLKTGLETK